ncbi:hypothetical protein Aperf_G00000112050 [Anoplocephala perfoliata]
MSWFTSSLLTSQFNCLRLGICSRKLAILATGKTHYRVLVIGGGTGGCTVAARLRDAIPAGAVGVIEPEEYHYYQPAWTLVGAGIMQLPETRIPMQEAIPNNAEWIRDGISSFDPVNNRVATAGGKQITYDYLVIALGIALRYDMIRGAREALHEDSRVCSNYSKEYVEKTFKAIRHFNGGTAIFTLPHTPIKCAGAPQKVMYLFEDYLVRKNRKKEARILYFTATNTMFSVRKYAEALEKICQERGILYHLGRNLVEVDHKRSTVIMENMKTKERQEYKIGRETADTRTQKAHLGARTGAESAKWRGDRGWKMATAEINSVVGMDSLFKFSTFKYDLLHLTPPMSPPEVLRTGADLSSPESNGFVNVDPGTLRHVKYGRIFALGDCSSLPTSRTAAAVASQSRALCENLIDLINGGSGDVAKVLLLIHVSMTFEPFLAKFLDHT